MELCDLLPDLGAHVEQARAVKADALTAAAERQINATARNYSLVYARELREGGIQPNDRDPYPPPGRTRRRRGPETPKPEPTGYPACRFQTAAAIDSTSSGVGKRPFAFFE